MKSPVLFRLVIRLLAAALLLSSVAPPALAGWPDCTWDPADPGVCLAEPKEDITRRTRIVINGRECRVAKVVLYRSRTYLPLRAFSECLGMTVNWFQREQTAVITGAPNTLGQAFDAYFRPVAESPTVRVVYGDNTEQRFHLDGAPYLDPDTNLTMVPFRFVTDLVNAKTSWTSATEGHPMNEVSVDLFTVAQPVDQWAQATQYVGFTEARGFFLLDSGSAGYDVYPSTLRHTSYALELYNAIIEEKGVGGADLDYNGFRVRTTAEHGLVDYLGAVTVRWMADEEKAQQYINAVDRQQRVIKGGTGVVTGALTLFFGATGKVVKALTSAAGFGVSAWSFFNEDWTVTLKACRERAGLSKYVALRPAGAPVLWGVADTPNGSFCVPYYSETPLSIMVKP